MNEAIQEFLFYSGFITAVKDESGHVLATNAPNAPYLLDISHIQPSQFYINEKKLAACKGWIQGPEDILIPIAIRDGKNIALDGHTRIKAALDLGYTSVYVYTEPYDEGIFHFVDEALRRGITGVASMEVVSDVEYAVKWDKFCDDYFANIS
ncbi:MAG: hypothetical protein FWG38_01455 [Defluviitaleaceae bacterium]|nr:hypothetical protein [Defluviitaleaceae bacterium]